MAMIDRHRIVATVCGLLAVGTAVAFPATAVAADLPPEPLPVPGDPAPPPPPGPTVPGLGALGPTGLEGATQMKVTGVSRLADAITRIGAADWD